MSTLRVSRGPARRARRVASGPSRRPTVLVLVHHALGVKIAVELGRHDTARAEAHALLDALADVETYLSQLPLEEPT